MKEITTEESALALAIDRRPQRMVAFDNFMSQNPDNGNIRVWFAQQWGIGAAFWAKDKAFVIHYKGISQFQDAPAIQIGAMAWCEGDAFIDLAKQLYANQRAEQE